MLFSPVGLVTAVWFVPHCCSPVASLQFQGLQVSGIVVSANMTDETSPADFWPTIKQLCGYLCTTHFTLLMNYDSGYHRSVVLH